MPVRFPRPGAAARLAPNDRPGDGRRLNSRQLETFAAVMKAGTISRAAELLGVTQPGVSRAIAELEKSLGFLLFDRIRNRIVATPEGKLFYAQVEASFLGMDSLRATAARTSR